MSFEHYVRSGTRQLRRGYTTGTCAALAAAGAAELLLTGKAPETLALLTPGGLRVEVTPECCRSEGRAAVCAWCLPARKSRCRGSVWKQAKASGG